MSRRRLIAALLLVAAFAWHVAGLVEGWEVASRDRTGRDFASYHYAVEVALAGGDPYDRAALSEAARAEGTRRGVHPFFYPPPFLLTMLWTAPLDLSTAYRAWFWLDELAAVLAAAALAWWWRPAGAGVAALASLALLTAVPNNHLMGQANLPVLMLVVAGLWAAERGRAALGGAALGLACMMKMSPALFVGWWALRGRWRAAGAAVVTALALTVLALPVADPAVQWRFYTEVLPGFGSGRYHGLAVGIDLFGNHSLPNLFDEAWPAGPRHLALSSTARAASTATALALVAATAWALRRPPSDALALAGQVGAIGVVMLLIPVFTYEHHLVWAWPAAAATLTAWSRRRLRPAWGLVLVPAVVVWWWDLAWLKSVWSQLLPDRPAAAWLVREAKLAALLVLYAASLALGARPAPPAIAQVTR